MSDEIPDEVLTLSEEYLDSLDADTSGDVEEVQAEVEYWDEQVEEFEEGTPMHEMAVEEHEEWREKLDSIEAQGERNEKLKSELLKRASTEFAPKGVWLRSPVIKALSHALTGKEREQLLVSEHRLSEELEEISKREMVSVAKDVHALARDALEGDERISELWDMLDTDTRLSIIQVLARFEEPLSSTEISDELGEGGTNSSGANIRKMRGSADIDPFYSTDDGYMLTLAGRYVWREYGEDNPPIEDGDAADEEAELEGEEADVDRDDVVDEVSASPEDGADDEGGDMDLSSFDVRE